MCVKLENEIFKVELTEKGAELASIKSKKNENEYIWTADSKYWGRHAPILFPIVGRLKNNQYRINDKVYDLSQHGFARDMKFEVKSKSDDKVVFKLSWNEETIKKYPYKFQLIVTYVLKGNAIEISYNVKNVDDKDIFFSIGAHAGFNCPVIGRQSEEDDLKFDDYYLEFEKPETVGVAKLNGDYLLRRNTSPFLYASNIINLDENLFKQGVLIFKDLISNSVSLKNSKNKNTITVKLDGFPYLGLWSKESGAPFVCIEPWFGHADFEDFDGDFREKDGGLRLEVGKEFTCTYSISINE